jgi:hypothetical protein
VNKKSLLSALAVIMIGGLFLASAMNFGTAQASTDVSGIIFSDTTWTKANSPINITGPTAIAKGVTLTIEPGVVVHFNLNTLEVNGTLRAVGTSSEPITLNGDWRGRAAYFGSSDYNGILTFTAESDGWNAQSETGCIIENVNVLSLTIRIYGATVRLNNNVFGGIHAWEGLSVNGGDSIISNNLITDGSILVDDGSPVFINNTLMGRAVTVQGGSPNIESNLFYTGFSGITVSDGTDVRVVNNMIVNCTGFTAFARGSITFEHNLVLYCSGGCSLYGHDVNITLQYNTIAFNQYGIQSPPPSAKIIYNNLENNIEYNLACGYSSNLDATYNWWGTTDASAISQTIVDYKNDYNLGNVAYIPFLDEPSPQAPLISSFVEPNPSPSAQSPTPTPPSATTPTPTPPNMGPTSPPTREPLLTPEQLEIVIVATIAVAVIGAGLGLLIYLVRRK